MRDSISVGRRLVEQIVWEHVRPLGMSWPKDDVVVVWEKDRVTFHTSSESIAPDRPLTAAGVYAPSDARQSVS